MMYWLTYDLTTGDVDQAGAGYMAAAAGPNQGSAFTMFALPSTDPASLWVKLSPFQIKQRLKAPTAPPVTMFSDKTLAMTPLADTRYIVNGVEKPASALLVNPVAGSHRIILRGLYYGEFVVQVIDRRAMMLAAAKAKRDALQMGIAPTTHGPVDIDLVSQVKINRIADRFAGLLNPLLGTVKFTFADDTEKTLTGAQFKQMAHEVGNFTDAVHQHWRTLKKAIKAPGADLSAIDVTAGWPAPGTA